MARVTWFTTDEFEVSKERPNPTNPISGGSLLLWLREQAEPRAQLTEPDVEDWDGRQYPLGPAPRMTRGSASGTCRSTSSIRCLCNAVHLLRDARLKARRLEQGLPEWREAGLPVDRG